MSWDSSKSAYFYQSFGTSIWKLSIFFFFVSWIFNAENMQWAFFIYFFLKNYFYDLNLYTLYMLYMPLTASVGASASIKVIFYLVYNAIQPILFKVFYSRFYYEMYWSYAIIYDVCLYVFVWYFVNFAISFTIMLFRFLSSILFRSQFKFVINWHRIFPHLNNLTV